MPLIEIEFTDRAETERKFIPPFGTPRKGIKVSVSDHVADSLVRQGFAIRVNNTKPKPKDTIKEVSQ